MYAFLLRFGTWLLQKLATAVIIVVLGVTTYGLWLFVEDEMEMEARRVQELTDLTRAQGQLVAVRERFEAEITTLRAAVRAEQTRVQQAERVIATLRSLESWWERIFGNKEQQQVNRDRLLEMEKLRDSAGAQAAKLSESLTGRFQQLADVETRLLTVERQLSETDGNRSLVVYYLERAWVNTRWYVIMAVFIFFVGPTLLKLLGYYVIAPLVSGGKALRLEESSGPVPDIGRSQVSIGVDLWPGETLAVKEGYLQSSDEGLTKKTRFLFDWAIPFTSVACQLTEMVELRNPSARGEQNITLSSAEDPHEELAIIKIPAESSLILRPSFLAGVITQGEDRLKIRRRWQFSRWQNWVTLQFRFFQFQGPCRLVVVGSRGVRGEVLPEREGNVRPARRTNSVATIGFSPELDYRPVRAETFWGYYRNMNPLFDDLFAGSGVFLLQETATLGQGRDPGKFWSTVWSGVLKIFGL